MTFIQKGNGKWLNRIDAELGYLRPIWPIFEGLGEEEEKDNNERALK